ncbi:MgtC/SapB family protein [Candidatus Woesearchaeota archaeon]|nr:MgtC/SapB family protein [Candidatus Woesearchaeota archaeon]
MHMIDQLLTGYEGSFIIKLSLCLLAGFLIGLERELKGKPAGISTQSLVIGGAMIFTLLSTVIDPNSPARIAAQIVSGVGFLGAGMILKSNGDKIKNLTTAATIWFAASLGMAIGFGWYVVACIATLYAVFVPMIPKMNPKMNRRELPKTN